MKIYTRTGDKGTTALFGGDRVRKDDARLAAYGTVDEANSTLGLARAHLHPLEGDAADRLDATLDRLQHELFVVGADLATPLGAKPFVPRISEGDVERLEHDIDAYQEELSPLKRFILPGGAPSASALHVARTVARRAERLTVAATEHVELNEHAAIYLNRLSDLLFVLARAANHAAGRQDVPWIPPSKTDDAS